MLFIKLDISKAFDYIRWQYLLEVLAALGFSNKWRNWIAAILASSSSKILINGRRIKHAQGLRQGDPLSPLLFIVATDPLQRIIEQAARRGFLQPVLPSLAKLRCSLYADDDALFTNPSPAELNSLQAILTFFGDCSGLRVNMAKTEIFPIRLQPDMVQSIIQMFSGRFPASLENTSAFRCILESFERLRCNL